MKKYKFNFLQDNKTADEFISEFNQHLKSRGLNMDEIKSEKYKLDILDYFTDIIDNKNIEALKAFEQLGFTASSSYFSLSSTITIVKKYSNFEGYLTILSRMGFFEEMNIRKEPDCILSSLLSEDNKPVLNKLIELGYPKTLTGDYIFYLWNNNNLEKIEEMIKEGYHYSLDIFACKERRGYGSLKEMQDHIKASYLIIDNSVDNDKTKKKYALDFLRRIIMSNASTASMVQEFVEKYDLIFPSSYFKIFSDYNIVKNVKRGYDDKFFVLYNNKDDLASTDNEITSFFSKVITTAQSVKFFKKCIDKNIPLTTIIGSEKNSLISKSLCDGLQQGMKMLEVIYPALLKEDEYKEISNLSLNEFIRKNIISYNGFTFDLENFKKLEDFIFNYFCNQENVNNIIYCSTTNNHIHAKYETLFSLSLKINNRKMAKKLASFENFNPGLNFVSYLKNNKGNIDEQCNIIKKIRNESLLRFIDLDNVKEKIEEIKKDPSNYILHINSEIERGLLLENLNKPVKHVRKKRI